MPDNPVDELVEEILDSGRAPEEICVGRPELLPDVLARLQRLRAVEAQVDSLFPPTEIRAGSASNVSSLVDAALPSIPEYEVQSILGRGGMGIVYKARHLRLSRNVALKMLLTGAYASRQEHLRFVREAESVAALRHPHIVQVYDFGEVDGHPFYTMEYSGGGSLAEKLAGVVQPAREAAEMIGALARAVQAAHESGIVHRDLKPANILLADDGTLKIADFGLARRLDQDSDLTRTGARIGTPSYMAPEQITGNLAAIGPAVDVFALGAILYEMLTGRPPFRGDSLSDTERRLTTQEAVPPSQVNPRAPRDLETICLKCLEKDPKNRYATAGDLADDLERFLRHEPIQARPVARLERGLRWSRRNPLATALAVTSLVAVGLVTSEMLQGLAQLAAGRAEKARLTSRIESGVQLVQEGRFGEARAILGKLGDGGFADLRERIDRVLREVSLVEELEAIGVKRATALNARDSTWLPAAHAATEYENLFAKVRIGRMTDDPESIARRIGTSDINKSLIAALDDWAVCESDEARRNWVLQVARGSNAGASDWENRCRDAATWTDREGVARLAETAPVAEASVTQLRALGDRLTAAGLDATPFLARVQREHVDSFLANLSLANALSASDPSEAIRYYQAALAIHPQSAPAQNNVAVALANLGRSAEATAQYEKALQLDPDSAATRVNLALALSQSRPDDAIGHLKRAIELNPKLGAAYRTLGKLLVQERRYAEAGSALSACALLLQDEAPEQSEVLELLRICNAQLQQ